MYTDELHSTGFFDLNGPFLRLLEDIPVIGYFVALVDVIEGDTVSEH